VLTADGCHFNRRTGDAILGVTASAGSASRRALVASAATSRGPLESAPSFLFARVAPFERFSTAGEKGEQALISPTVAGIAWKAST
jgi:hypothetical protein